MNNQKAENLLNLALDATEEEREKSLNLQVGYEPTERTWELIIKYDQTAAAGRPELAEVVPLSFGFGIIRVRESEIPTLLNLPEVEYVEKPKRLFFAVNQGKAASCFSGLPEVEGNVSAGKVLEQVEGNVTERTVPEATRGTAGQMVYRPLDGTGTIVAVIDSGVDYFHPDFRNEDGTSRILAIWDQTINSGQPPEGFRQGSEFNQEQINEALAMGSRQAGYNLVPTVDNSGHGTAVLGIAAGNGNASGGIYAGGAPGSDILVVKLGLPGSGDFPSTTQLMMALEYVIRKAESYGKPVAVNLSFGNVYGSHTGTSLLETYMNAMAGAWKNVIVVGSGNEGAGYGHTAGVLRDDQVEIIELSVSEFEPTLNLQLWKNYVDEFEVALVHPSGQRITLPTPERLTGGSDASAGPGGSTGMGGSVETGAPSVVGGSGRVMTGVGGPGTSRYRLGQTELLVYYGVPAPYSTNQEIYLDFLPLGNNQYIDSGIWKIELTPKRILKGDFDLWLPGTGALNSGTRFLRPSPQVTLTIPSTAEKVISVGAYDAHTLSYASFSGRGNTRYPEKVKPDLAAPGVDITTTAVGGGYAAYTGTSFATPFVTAAAALLMQWGIAWGNDPYLYGEKVRAYLRKGARQLPGYEMWPNNQLGYGALCLRDSFPE